MNYILAIGINDYRNRSGGTNKVIQAHQELLRDNDFGYIYIYPIFAGRMYLWGVIIDGYYDSVKSTQQLLYYLYKQRNKNICEIHLHHLLFASLVEVDDILKCIRVSIKFYIHDYYTICPSINLLKNDTEFCGGEKMSYSKCRECKYYSTGKERSEQIKELIKTYEQRICFIIPSDTAKDIWLEAFEEYRSKVKVIYHQKLQGKYSGNRKLISNKIKVGYLGEISFAKGWNAWNAVLANASNSFYEYYYFGKSKIKVSNVIKIKVDFRKNINAMMDALRNTEVDCVILWSVCEETYSYTYYESLASNTFVITNIKSGNIARQVKERGNGLVLYNENQLIMLFLNFELLKGYINEYKKNGVPGPDKLIENPDIINLINSSKNDEDIEIVNSKPGLTELIISNAYRVLQAVYYIKRKLL